MTTLFNQAQLFFPPEVQISAEILVFSGESLGAAAELVASLHAGDSLHKLQFNISHIFAVLMINFFVCRVDSLGFSLWLPTPTRTHSNITHK